MADHKVFKGTTIDDIPNEILSAIFFYLPGKKSLLQISLTNQRFNKIVERFRYHTIRLYLNSGSTAGPGLGFDQLLSRLSTRPELQSYI